MFIEDIKLAELPSVYLLNKDNLPNCAAILCHHNAYMDGQGSLLSFS